MRKLKQNFVDCLLLWRERKKRRRKQKKKERGERIPEKIESGLFLFILSERYENFFLDEVGNQLSFLISKPSF